jgi:type I restriction enzyme S subunit
MKHWDKKKLLDDLVKENIISLDRGRVISSIDLVKYPGIYPVYSSSSQKNGLFGNYDKFDFDEELITWSVDGGGYFFYRPKHKFSVTNVSGILKILKSNLFDYKFLYYNLDYQHSRLYYDYIDKAHPSVIKKQYYIPDIDLIEQRKIASILSKLDEAIAQTEQLIEKYKQIKIGLMHDLLTCGIDEQGNIRAEETHKFKDSPLGRIPVEWDVVKLGVSISDGGGFIQTGPFGSQLHANEYTEEGTPVIMPQNILQEGIDKRTLSFITSKKANVLKRHMTNKGDIIFARRGDLSKCAVIEYQFDRAICGTGCLLIRIRKADINPYWLRMLYQQFNYQKEINTTSVGSTMQNLNTEILSNLLIPRISRIEQNLIVKRIQGIDTLTEKSINNCNKLAKKKSGLMHDLLTGKVRVNNK